MKKKKAKDNRYKYPLKLDENLKEPFLKLVEVNRRNINDEINLAIEAHLERNKDKIK